MTQFTIEDGFDTEREARCAAPRLAKRLIKDLTGKGYVDFKPPPMPKGDQVIDCYRVHHSRVLVMYLPPWALSRFRDKFVARADVLAAELSESARA